MQNSTVALNDVRFRYTAEEVLHGITFSLAPGEIVGLLGPNGAGKSTTLKIIAGIQAATSGTARVVGLELPGGATEVKQRIGYVPESGALFESLTGQEFLELMGRLHLVEEDVLQDRIAKLLETFGLSSDRVRPLSAYSKGMRQKILISGALLHNPELILLDEPLTGLDVDSAIIVKDLLAALAADGRTILYSSHVLDVVEKICNRVLIIHKGNLIADESPAHLKDRLHQSSLEEAFRELTDSQHRDPHIAAVIASLQS